MFVFDRLSPYSYYNNKEKYKDDDEDEKRDFSLKESLWFCMTSLTPQGKLLLPFATVNIFHVFLLLLSVLICTQICKDDKIAA